MKNAICAMALVVACAGCFSSGYNVRMESDPVRVVRPVEVKSMREAILKGGANRGWMMRSEKTGCVTLVLNVRGGKHSVVVDVLYTGDEFSVKYVESSNMDYEPATGAIRGKYIQWVRNLKQDILLEASKIR